MKLDFSLGMVLTEDFYKDKFKGKTKEIVTNFLKAKFKRTQISLPISFLQPKSLLQSLAESFISFSCLEQAYASSSAIDRMKHVMCFVLGGLHTSLTHFKPFTCLLGETFEGVLPDNSQIYFECVSSSPVTVRVLIMQSEGHFSLSGWIEFNAISDSLLGTKLKIVQNSSLKLTFYYLTPLEISYTLPNFQVINSTDDEKRGVYWSDDLFFSDKINCLEGIVRFSPTRVDKVTGGIWELGESDRPSKKDILDKIKENSLDSVLKGSYMSDLKFDDTEYWNITTKYQVIKAKQRVLPSDGRFREDLLWLLYSYSAIDPKEQAYFEQLASEWKLLIEENQNSYTIKN